MHEKPRKGRLFLSPKSVFSFVSFQDPDDPLVECVRTPGLFPPNTQKRMANYGEHVDEWIVRATAQMIGRDIKIVSSSIFEDMHTQTVECLNPGQNEPLLVGELMDGCHFVSLGSYVYH